MTITAKIIADSISETGKRITTMQLRYPRFIHAEFMTHRVFSRNASSSRAIPVERMIQDVLNDTAMPIHWGANQKGMQANGQLSGPALGVCKSEWELARDKAIESAREMIAQGLHKQIANRLLEPFSHINVLVTATEWTNFFALRDHKDAQPEIAELARQMKAAMAASKPELLGLGQWHLPYVTNEDWNSVQAIRGSTLSQDRLGVTDMIRLSVARCASVSYKTVDGKPMTIERAIALYDKLLAADLIHASPAEHQATPDQEIIDPERYTEDGSGMPAFRWMHPDLHGNFSGWIQYRKTLPNENITEMKE